MKAKTFKIVKTEDKTIDPANPPLELTLRGGAPYTARLADCQARWKKYGWVPPSQNIKRVTS